MRKTAIVVGATSGIGRQLAILLVQKNYLVGVTGRRKELLESLKSESPDNIIISDFDVTDTFEATRKLDDLTAQLGGLDLLLLSSGVGELNGKIDFVIEKATIDVNVVGFTAVADWAFKYFWNQKYGHLIAITSLAGLRGSRHAPAYFATKAFQINYLEGLRQKARHLKMPIYITDIRPGFVNTKMAQGDGKFWVSSVEKAASQILNAIESKKAVAYITRRWRIIAAILKSLPRQIHKRV